MPRKPLLDNQNEFEEESTKEHPPAATEAFGPPPAPGAGVPNANDPEVVKEKARLDRMGVVSEDYPQNVRGVNVVAEGHHMPDARNYPLPEKGGAGAPGEYKVNNYGMTIPAEQIAGPAYSAPVVPVLAPVVPPPVATPETNKQPPTDPTQTEHP